MCSLPIRAFYSDELVHQLGSKKRVKEKIELLFSYAQSFFYDETLNVPIKLSVEAIIYKANAKREWKAEGRVMGQIQNHHEVDFDRNIQSHVIFGRNRHRYKGVANWASVCSSNPRKRTCMMEYYPHDYNSAWVSFMNFIN